MKSGELIKECEVFKDMNGMYTRGMVLATLGKTNNKIDILDHRTEKFRKINTDNIDTWNFK